MPVQLTDRTAQFEISDTCLQSAPSEQKRATLPLAIWVRLDRSMRQRGHYGYTVVSREEALRVQEDHASKLIASGFRAHRHVMAEEMYVCEKMGRIIE